MSEHDIEGVEIAKRNLQITEVERQVFGTAVEILKTGVTEGAISQVVEIIKSAGGCEVDFVKTGSNPNKGSFSRVIFPNGKISIMATNSDSLEQQLVNLVHEFSMLQLHKICIPENTVTNKQRNSENAVEDFIQGVKLRINEELEMAKYIRDEEFRTSVIKGNQYKLKRMEEDLETYKQKAFDFLMYH